MSAGPALGDPHFSIRKIRGVVRWGLHKEANTYIQPVLYKHLKHTDNNNSYCWPVGYMFSQLGGSSPIVLGFQIRGEVRVNMSECGVKLIEV